MPPKRQIMKKEKEEGEKEVVCGDCGEKMLQKNIHRHNKTVHLGVKTFICPFCDKKYTTKQNLNNHIVMHVEQGDVIASKERSMPRLLCCLHYSFIRQIII